MPTKFRSLVKICGFLQLTNSTGGLYTVKIIYRHHQIRLKSDKYMHINFTIKYIIFIVFRPKIQVCCHNYSSSIEILFQASGLAFIPTIRNHLITWFLFFFLFAIKNT